MNMYICVWADMHKSVFVYKCTYVCMQVRIHMYVGNMHRSLNVCICVLCICMYVGIHA